MIATPQKRYESALAWIEFYKQNRRKITISRREVEQLKKQAELNVTPNPLKQ